MSEPALLVCARRLRAARGVVVARDVTLTAAPGDVVAIEGPNGSGKSTLLAAAAGLLPADRASVRPGSVGYSPERAGVLPRVPLRSWLLGLARTAGLDRHESARRAGDLLDRLGLAHASAVSLHALSRGNAQRALVAQALLADPDLLILDEPAGGMDADGVSRVAAEIQRAASRRAVVLVARHPTAPLPLPSGLTWRLHEGTVDTRRRESDGKPLAAGTMEVETGDGTVRLVDEAGLPAVLRAALDAGLAIRRVQPAPGAAPDVTASGVRGGRVRGRGPLRRGGPGPLSRCCTARCTGPGCSPRRSGSWPPRCCSWSCWASSTRPTPVPRCRPRRSPRSPWCPLMTWLSVLAQRVDGRELARAFAAHVGGRARAHLAADLGLAPFAVLLSLAALVAPLISQGEHPHPALLDGKIVLLHLAAAVFGAGIGSLLALIERAGWRLLAAVALYLVLFVARVTPMTPLLRLSTHPATLATPAGGPAAWLFLPGLALMALAALLAARLT